MNKVVLAKCGSLVAQKTKNIDYVICLCRILTTGTYIDMKGPKVDITDEIIIQLVDNYNKKLEFEYNKQRDLIEENSNELPPEAIQESLINSIDDFDFLPNKIDHRGDLPATVGNVLGRMQVRKSQGKLAVFAYIKVKGAENVAPVMDNRWRNLSVGFDMDKRDFTEVSWVTYGADSDANKVFSKNNTANLQKKLYNDNQDIVELAISTINTLERTIFMDKKLLTLCKLRKLTKAEAYFIKKELKDVKEVTTLNKIFNILNSYLKVESKEKFLPSSKIFIQNLDNLTKAASNGKNY